MNVRSHVEVCPVHQKFVLSTTRLSCPPEVCPVHQKFVLSTRSLSSPPEVCPLHQKFVLFTRSLSCPPEVCPLHQKFVLFTRSLSCPPEVCPVHQKFVLSTRSLSCPPEVCPVHQKGNVQTKALLRSSSFLRRAREIQERERFRSGIQDDSIVFSESKSVGLNMKAKQRRIESFNVGRTGGRLGSTPPGGRAVVGSSTSLSSPLPPQVPTDYGLQKPPSPRQSAAPPNAGIKKLSNWATVQDLTNKNKPLSVRTSNVNYQNPLRSGPLSPAKSTLGLTHMAENVPPYSQYASYTSVQVPSLAYTMSTPDISAGQVNASPTPRSPSWYPQKFSKPLFDFSISDRENREMVGDNVQYANPSYSEFAARLNTVKKNERRSLPTNMLPRFNDYQNLKDLHTEESSKTFQSKPNRHNIDDSLETEIPNGPLHPAEDPRPLYSPPAPPVRDISSLKYMNQAHEKYPSWPVSSPNTDMSVRDTISSPASSWLDSSKSENKKMGQPFHSQLHVLKERNSPTSENRSDEKPARNASDPGFKSPSPLKQFIKVRVPTTRERDQAKIEKKSNHFEEIIKSKPGYPLPMRDCDGHSYDDEKYSIPSPPERDMPGVDEKSLGHRITSLVAPSYIDQYENELRVSTDQKKDSTTSPLQSPVSSNQYQSRNNGPLKAFPIPQNKVDMATSPLQSPNESKFILGGFPNNNQSNSYNPSNAYNQAKNRGYIVKTGVTPYYNTGTQTEEVAKIPKQHAAKRPKNLLPESRPTQNPGEYQKFRDISIQARMSSQSSDSDHDAISPKGDVSASTVESRTSMMQSVSTDYTAPMMRKLSEEYLTGRLKGGHVEKNDKQHSTSSSFDFGARSPSFGGLKEAESYNSVIIHPGESSKPFGKDYENVSTTFSQDSINTEPEPNYFVYPKTGKGRYSLDPTILRTPPFNSSLQQRNSYDSRYSSAQALTNTYSNLNSNLTETSTSVSMLDIKSDQSRVSQYSSSDVSPVSQPRSSDDTRTSKSTSFASENSPLSAKSNDPNDSVFNESKSPAPSVSNSSESQSMPVMSRKISMKKAYGTYDEFDNKMLGNHRRQQSDPSNNSSKDRHSDYVLMDLGHGLDEIPEDTAETRWAETVKKSQNLYQNTSLGPTDKSSSKSSEQMGDKSSVHHSSVDKDYEEVNHSLGDPAKKKSESSEMSMTKENVQNSASVSEIVSFAENELTEETNEINSESREKKIQLELYNYMNRFNLKRRTSFQSRDSSHSSQPESPSPDEQSPHRISIPPMSKIQKPDNLVRVRSLSSPKNSHSDYVEMKHPQTAWSILRSKTSSAGPDSFKQPLLHGSEANIPDTYAISPFSPHSGEKKPAVIHTRYNSDSGTGQHQMQKNRSSSVGEPKQTASSMDVSKSVGNGSKMPPSPLYQNVRYLRPPPVPPPDGTRVEDQPPALPPRNYKKFHSSQSDSSLQASRETKGYNALPSSSQNLNTGSPPVDSYVGSPQVDSYVDKIREASKKISNKQFRPTGYSLVSTKTTPSYSHSFRKEPIKPHEATSPPASVSSSPLATSPLTIASTNSVREQNVQPDNQSAMLLREYGQEAPPLPPPPSPPRKTDAGSDDFTQPTNQPPQSFREVDQEQHQEHMRYPKDTYAATVFQKSRQPGVYRRTVSAGDGLHAYAEKNNNYKDPIEVSPQRVVPESHWSEERVESRVNFEHQNGDVSVPVFQAAEVVNPNVYRGEAKPLQAVSRPVQRTHSQSHFSSPKPFESENKSGASSEISERRKSAPRPDVLELKTNESSPENEVQDQKAEQPSVRDRILNLEKISRSPSVEPVRYQPPKIHLRNTGGSPRNSLENLNRSRESSPQINARLHSNRPVTHSSQGNVKQNPSPRPLPRSNHARQPLSPTTSSPSTFKHTHQHPQYSPLSKPPLPLPHERRADPAKTVTPPQENRYDDHRYRRSNSPKLESGTNVNSVSSRRHHVGEPSPKPNADKVAEYNTSDRSPSLVSTDIHEQTRVLSDPCQTDEVPSLNRIGDDSLEQSNKENQNLTNGANDQYFSQNVPESDSRQSEKSDSVSQDNLKRASVSSDVFVDNASTGATKLQVIHPRQPSQEELECEVKVQELVKELPESDKSLTNVLKPENKSRMHYMNGLFVDSLSISRESLGSRHSPSSSFSKEDSRDHEDSSEKTDNSAILRKESISLPPTYWVSPPVAMMELEIRKCDEAHQEFTKDIDNSDSLIKKKGELMDSIVKKLDILKDERRDLQREVEDNELIGKKIDSIVEEKCSRQQRDKFRTYIDDMDKIVKLLLKLSGLLARAENAVQGLPTNAADHQKKSALEKRIKLREQHEEAQSLKSDIDKRKDQVSNFLLKCFTELEMEDYTYFVKMKSKLTIQTQELDDKIKLGEEQLQALRRSIPDI
ncbi:hypothetical protein ScPMuIL_011403 [Solemya velum]